MLKLYKNFGNFFWRRGQVCLKKDDIPTKGDMLYLDYRVKGKRKRAQFDILKIGSKMEQDRIEESAQRYLNGIADRIESGEIFENEENQYPTYKQMALFWWEKDYCKREYMKDPMRQSSDYGKLVYGIQFFVDDKNNSIHGDRIQREDVKRFRMHLKAIGSKQKKIWKSSYINRIVAMVGQIYHGCIDQEIYTYDNASPRDALRYGKIELCVNMNNPVHGLPKLYEEPVEPVVPTREQFITLLGFLPPVLKYCALIGIHTGLRKRNIFELKIKEVHLSDSELVIESTKNFRLPIIIKLHSDLISLFKHLSEFWRDDQVYVFEKVPGQPYKTMKDSWEKACREAKIPGFQFRHLRTTYATWRVQENISMPLLQAAMGHSTSQTTSRYYNKARKATEVILKTQPSVYDVNDL